MIYHKTEVIIKHHDETCGMRGVHSFCLHAKCFCGGYAHLIYSKRNYRRWICLLCGADFRTVQVGERV